MVLISRCSRLHQLLFVPLDGGDVGADRHVAAVLGAALADVQPAAVLELGLEGARAGDLARRLITRVRTTGLRPAATTVVIGRAGPDRLVGQVVQRQEIGVAQHHAVVRVPQHEGLRDGLDRVAQAQIGLDGLLDQRLLLGDVDGDADQVRRGLARLLHQLAARAQPHPVAVGVAHAEGVVDRRGLGFGELCGKLIEMQVLRMDQRIDLAEAQQLVLRLEPQDREHRMRPEDAAARRAPSPTGRSGRG